MKLLYTLLTLAFVIMVNANAETIDLLKRKMIVSEGETRSIVLPENVFVQKILIQAQSANFKDSYGEVIVNGDIKGTLYLPGADPHYVVTVAEYAQTLEFTAIQNSMLIRSIKAVVVTTSSASVRVHEDMGELSQLILSLHEELGDKVGFEQYGEYILPVIIKASNAIVFANTHGDLGQEALSSFFKLSYAMKKATPFYNELLERDQDRQLIIEILSLKERIRMILD